MLLGAFALGELVVTAKAITPHSVVNVVSNANGTQTTTTITTGPTTATIFAQPWVAPLIGIVVLIVALAYVNHAGVEMAYHAKHEGGLDTVPPRTAWQVLQAKHRAERRALREQEDAEDTST
jgi:hypothetical protein